MDPNLVDMQYVRTDCALWIDHAQQDEFLAEFETALKPEDFSASSCRAFCELVLRSAPEIQERLIPMVHLMAKKAVEKEPGQARVLAPAFHLAGYQDKADEMLKAYPNPEAGSTHYEQIGGIYTVTGIGSDIWNRYDDFHFAHKNLSGDGSITARIDDIETVQGWTKAGVMIRQSLEADSPNVMALVTANGRLSLQYRSEDSGITYGRYTAPDTVRLPHWVRLVRRGIYFTAQHSEDGANWHDVLDGSEQPAATEIPMHKPAYVGLAVTSHDVTKRAKAQMSDVRTTGQVNPIGPFTKSRDICLQFPAVPH
jgi:hypothetical protein